MKYAYMTACCLLSMAGTPAIAATVNIDLSGATTGTLITGVGGSFAQRFAGETVVGTGITGSPTNPLTLSPAGSISVELFNPTVSAASNSLLSQPNNAAPLALLLASAADSLTFTAGSFGGGSVTADFFAINGALLGTRVFSIASGYGIFSASGLGTFRGVQFRDNNDGAGLRFQNFSYNSVATVGVPEPATWGMMLLGFGGMGYAMRRRTKVSARIRFA